MSSIASPVHSFITVGYWLYSGFSSHSNIFHSYVDVIITGEKLQILTYARHLWPLSSEGSLVCHTYCDRGHPFIKVISEDPWHSHLMLSVWQWSCRYLNRSVTAGFENPTFRLWGERSNPLRHRCGGFIRCHLFKVEPMTPLVFNTVFWPFTS